MINSMLNSSVLRKFALILMGTFFLISCDKDFNEIGSGLVGEDHFDFEQDSLSTVTAFTRKTGAVETLNLPINPLGIFDNAKFGKTTANFVTQVSLVTENPTFTNVTPERITSVVLNVPYFSTLTGTDDDGENEYRLDSIYGNVAQPFKLSVYENGYYLRNFDPTNNFGIQRYYSDQNSMFDAAKIGASPSGAPVTNGAPLNNGVGTQNGSFIFSNAQLSNSAADEDSDPVKSPPGMRLDLNKEYFYKRIFQNAGSNLLNNNAFQNYFRGLYFKVEETGNGGALALLNFARGTITITYEDESSAGIVSDRTLVLNLTGNSVSLTTRASTPLSAEYDAVVGNSATGDSKLFLKGGEGAIAFIDLFGGGNSAELDELRNTAITNNWLVNEAHIVFNVDVPSMSSSVDPNRIYLYDATNRRSLIDYGFDGSVNNSNPKLAKSRFDGIAQLTGNSGDENRKAKKYRIRITDHIKNVIFNDSTNVRLGLAITENISNTANLTLKTQNSEFRNLPLTSVLSPLGTIIYGSNLPETDSKKIRLVISFTKPD